MGNHNICLDNEVDKKYTGCMKTTEWLDCALIGVCAVIRSNTGCPSPNWNLARSGIWLGQIGILIYVQIISSLLNLDEQMRYKTILIPQNYTLMPWSFSV